ncbi:hypothetical protein HAX54_047673, partial [Datura stramonium]|nr:hypothetical protein [Datura stramonium]
RVTSDGSLTMVAPGERDIYDGLLSGQQAIRDIKRRVVSAGCCVFWLVFLMELVWWCFGGCGGLSVVSSDMRGREDR